LTVTRTPLSKVRPGQEFVVPIRGFGLLDVTEAKAANFSVLVYRGSPRLSNREQGGTPLAALRSSAAWGESGRRAYRSPRSRFSLANEGFWIAEIFQPWMLASVRRHVHDRFLRKRLYCNEVQRRKDAGRFRPEVPSTRPRMTRQKSRRSNQSEVQGGRQHIPTLCVPLPPVSRVAGVRPPGNHRAALDRPAGVTCAGCLGTFTAKRNDSGTRLDHRV
jgi:hypothetical protein